MSDYLRRSTLTDISTLIHTDIYYVLWFLSYAGHNNWLSVERYDKNVKIEMKTFISAEAVFSASPGFKTAWIHAFEIK